MTPWFVVNPYAGQVRGDETTSAIRRELRGRAATLSPALPGDVSTSRLVVAVGGDGTINRVINGCDLRRLRLAMIPRGSANDLAAELSVPGDLRGAWDVLEAGNEESIDVVSVNGRRFVTCGGLGLASDVALRANRWKASDGWWGRGARGLGSFVYLLAALREIQACPARSLRATIRAGHVVRCVDLGSAFVSNQPRLGGFFSPSPEASNQDGALHFCGVRAARTRRQLLRQCADLVGGAASHSGDVFQLRARSLTIDTDTDVTFFGDGEPLAHGRRFQLEVLPGALTVVSGRQRAAWAQAA